MSKPETNVKVLVDGEAEKMIHSEAGLQFVLYTTEWCTPGDLTRKAFDHLSLKYPEIEFYIYDMDKGKQRFNPVNQVEGIPTVHLFFRGILLHKRPGTLAKYTLEGIIKTYSDPEFQESFSLSSSPSSSSLSNEQ